MVAPAPLCACTVLNKGIHTAMMESACSHHTCALCPSDAWDRVNDIQYRSTDSTVPVHVPVRGDRKSSSGRLHRMRSIREGWDRLCKPPNNSLLKITVMSELFVQQWLGCMGQHPEQASPTATCVHPHMPHGVKTDVQLLRQGPKSFITSITSRLSI